MPFSAAISLANLLCCSALAFWPDNLCTNCNSTNPLKSQLRSTTTTRRRLAMRHVKQLEQTNLPCD